MKATYICDVCQGIIGTVEDENLSAEELGLESLTAAEKQDIIRYTDEAGLMITSLCDRCIAELGLESSEVAFVKPPELH